MRISRSNYQNLSAQTSTTKVAQYCLPSSTTPEMHKSKPKRTQDLFKSSRTRREKASQDVRALQADALTTMRTVASSEYWNPEKIARCEKKIDKQATAISNAAYEAGRQQDQKEIKSFLKSYSSNFVKKGFKYIQLQAVLGRINTGGMKISPEGDVSFTTLNDRYSHRNHTSTEHTATNPPSPR